MRCMSVLECWQMPRMATCDKVRISNLAHFVFQSLVPRLRFSGSGGADTVALRTACRWAKWAQKMHPKPQSPRKWAGRAANQMVAVFWPLASLQ